MPLLWIVHRDPRQRAALARLAAAPEDAVLGAPGDPQFDVVPPGEVILLGLDGDWEAELEYAHAVQPRVRGAHWILLGEAAAQDEALRLFDTLCTEFLAYPPMPDTLRAKIRSARRTPPAPSLSQRASRQAVAGRFSRWFSDLELSELLRALDPHLADVPLLLRRAPGATCWRSTSTGSAGPPRVHSSTCLARRRPAPTRFSKPWRRRGAAARCRWPRPCAWKRWNACR